MAFFQLARSTMMNSCVKFHSYASKAELGTLLSSSKCMGACNFTRNNSNLSKRDARAINGLINAGHNDKLFQPLLVTSTVSTSKSSLFSTDPTGNLKVDKLEGIEGMGQTKDLVKAAIASGLALFTIGYMWFNRKQARDQLLAALATNERLKFELAGILELSSADQTATPKVQMSEDVATNKENNVAKSVQISESVYSGSDSKTNISDSDSKTNISGSDSKTNITGAVDGAQGVVNNTQTDTKKAEEDDDEDDEDVL